MIPPLNHRCSCFILFLNNCLENYSPNHFSSFDIMICQMVKLVEVGDRRKSALQVCVFPCTIKPPPPPAPHKIKQKNTIKKTAPPNLAHSYTIFPCYLGVEIWQRVMTPYMGGVDYKWCSGGQNWPNRVRLLANITCQYKFRAEKNTY